MAYNPANCETCGGSHASYYLSCPTPNWPGGIRPKSSERPLSSQSVCAECGEHEDHANIFCMMSRDGEGPHTWMEPAVPITREQAAVLGPIFEHLEQGAMEL